MKNEKDPVSRLLSRRAGPGSDGDREAALLALLPTVRREKVIARLSLIDAFMNDRAAGRGDAVATAKLLGLSVRSLYRLVRRVEEMGAVAALAPTAAAGRKRRSDVDGTLSEDVRKLIFDSVMRSPNESLTALVSRIRNVDPTASASTIRRSALRFRRDMDPMDGLLYGGRWLMDRAALRIPVLRDGGTFWLVADFLVDMDTGIIAGRAVPGPDGGTDFGALLHALGRAPTLLQTKMKFAAKVSEVTWAVPDGVPERADAVRRNASALRPPVNATLLTADKFRLGSELARVVGGSLSGIDVLIRATADPRAILEKTDPEPMHVDAALRILDAELGFHHRWASKWVSGPGSNRSPSATRTATLQRLMGRLVDVFEPVLPEDDLVLARELVDAIGG